MSLKPIISLTDKYTGFGVRKWNPPTDLSGLHYAPTIKHLKSTIVGQRLDKSSSACKYFGVDSSENLRKNLKHHEKLNKANETWRTSNYSFGNIINLGVIPLKGIKTEKEILYKGQRIGIHGRPWTMIDEIKSQGAAKITFIDNIFGIMPNGGMHTIGLVTKNNYLYVLDSLGEQTTEIKAFHSKIQELFSDAGFKDIIFSSKIQQPLDEFTCNNWTFANIKSVVNELYGREKQITTQDELNKILREDINNILNEQHEQAIWY